jgi:hypothetical protein
MQSPQCDLLYFGGGYGAAFRRAVDDVAPWAGAAPGEVERATFRVLMTGQEVPRLFW